MVAKHDKGENLVSGVINLVLVFSCHKVVIVLRPEKKKRPVILLCFIFLIGLKCVLVIEWERVVLSCAISWVDIHSPHVSTAKSWALTQSVRNTFEMFLGVSNFQYQ